MKLTHLIPVTTLAPFVYLVIFTLKIQSTKYFNRTILNKNTFKSLIQDLVKINIEALNWTGGGEPTQNPYLGEAIKYINENSNIEMGMFTNGTLLEKMKLMDVVVDCLKWIRISIDAGNAESYNKLGHQ